MQVVQIEELQFDFIKPELDRLHQELASLQKNLREVEGHVPRATGPSEPITRNTRIFERAKERARLEEQRLQLALSRLTSNSWMPKNC